MKNIIKQLRKDLAPDIAEIWASFDGQFDIAEARLSIEALLRVKDLNGYAAEIAHLVTQAEDHKRSKPIPRNRELFTQEFAENTFLRLGEGLRVRMADATYEHWLTYREQEFAHLRDVTDSIHRTGEQIGRMREFAASNPGITTREVERLLGNWPAEAEQDEEAEPA